MTIAVCLECGRIKAGAWTSCTACNYQPRGVEEMAKALMVSDSCIAADRLAEFAARRQKGEPWIFESGLLDQFKGRLAALIPLTADGELALMVGGLAPDEVPPRTSDGSVSRAGEP